MLMRLALNTRNAMANAVRDLIDAGANGGTIKVYSGVQPGSADASLSGNTLLGTLTFASISAPDADGGKLTFNAIADDLEADANGLAAWARIQDSDGGNIFDVDVSEAAGNGFLKLNTVNIVAGLPIRCSAASFTMPAN